MNGAQTKNVPWLAFFWDDKKMNQLFPQCGKYRILNKRAGSGFRSIFQVSDFRGVLKGVLWRVTHAHTCAICLLVCRNARRGGEAEETIENGRSDEDERERTVTSSIIATMKRPSAGAEVTTRTEREAERVPRLSPARSYVKVGVVRTDTHTHALCHLLICFVYTPFVKIINMTHAAEQRFILTLISKNK